MLQGIVDLATEATDCHACFIYLLEDGLLTIRAASPVYAGAVGVVQMRLDEGLTGWVARHRTPEFIRDNAMADPRMKFFPLLEEERFQSMVAVPIVARSGDTIGVIVLHTEAPREFTEDTLKLLVHIASLVSGAIENAQLYDQQRRRVDALTSLSGLAQEVATAADAAGIGQAVTRGMRRLLGAEICQLYRLDHEGGALSLLSSAPDGVAAAEAVSATALLLAASEGGGSGPRARTLWPRLDVSALLVTPLVSGGERLGLLCAGAPAAATVHRRGDRDGPRGRAPGRDRDQARRADRGPDQRQHRQGSVRGALRRATARSPRPRPGRCAAISSRPYLMLCAEPAGGLEQGSGEWRAAAEMLGRDVSELAPRAAVEAGPGPVRAVLSLGNRATESAEEVAARLPRARPASRRGGRPERAARLRGRLRPRLPPGARCRADRPGAAAATVARSATPRWGRTATWCTSRAENAPHDRMRAAVDRLIEYDARRRTALLDTLERYLAERRSVIESARELFIHPNTLRQRLGRIEELTGLNLDEDDLLSLELAIKLARLHGRPAEAAAKASRRPGTRGSWPAAARAGAPGTRGNRPRRRLRSGSAAITIASQPANSAS